MILTNGTDKVVLSRSTVFPNCPWCEAVLSVVHWHKVRAGPPLEYVAVLSCPHCHGVLDGIAHTDHTAGVV